jgi:hypothetical protein
MSGERRALSGGIPTDGAASDVFAETPTTVAVAPEGEAELLSRMLGLSSRDARMLHALAGRIRRMSGSAGNNNTSEAQQQQEETTDIGERGEEGEEGRWRNRSPSSPSLSLAQAGREDDDNAEERGVAGVGNVPSAPDGNAGEGAEAEAQQRAGLSIRALEQTADTSFSTYVHLYGTMALLTLGLLLHYRKLLCFIAIMMIGGLCNRAAINYMAGHRSATLQLLRALAVVSVAVTAGVYMGGFGMGEVEPRLTLQLYQAAAPDLLNQVWLTLLCDRLSLACTAFSKVVVCAVFHVLGWLGCRRRLCTRRSAPLLPVSAARAGEGVGEGGGSLPAGRQRALLKWLETSLVCVDGGFAIYRRLLPVLSWMAFFEGGHLWLWFIFSAGYLLLKLLDCVDVLRHHARSLRDACAAKLPFGKLATQQEVEAAGGMCAICHDDLSDSIVLPCSHTFCGDCINQWLAKKASCPVCRADVPERKGSPLRRGETAIALILI